MKHLFIFSFLFITYPSFANDCKKIFSPKTIEEQIESRGKYALLSDFGGQNGYLSLAEKISTESNHNYNMQSIFNKVSKFLGTDFKVLQWKIYKGSVEEALDLRSKIAGRGGNNIKREYYGMNGYIYFAEKHFGGNMQETIENVSAVLEQKTFERLNWKEYQGQAIEARELRFRILNRDGTINKDYYGIEGYKKFAEEHFGGDMFKAYVNTSDVLEKRLFKKLNWSKYKDSVEKVVELQTKPLVEDKEITKLKSKILDKKPEVKKIYSGLKGYMRFAKEHFKGDMQTAFENTSVALAEELFKDLKWKIYKGSVEEAIKLKSEILDENGEIKEDYYGMKGYTKIVEDYFNFDVDKAFGNVSVVLGRRLFKKLNWQEYNDLVEEEVVELRPKTLNRKKVIELRSKILDTEPKVKKVYYGMEAYMKFAEQHFKADMQTAFEKTSVALGSELFKKLNWKIFYGTVEQYQNLQELISKNNIEDLKAETEASTDELFRSSFEDALKNLENSEYVKEVKPINSSFLKVTLNPAEDLEHSEYMVEIQPITDELTRDSLESLKEEEVLMERFNLIANTIFEGNKAQALKNMSLFKPLLRP